LQNKIKNIFKNNMQLLYYSDKSIIFIKKQNYNKGLWFYKKVIDIIMNMLQDLILNSNYFNEQYEVINTALVNSILEELLAAQENQDYVLIADLLEMRLNSLIKELQIVIVQKEDNGSLMEEFYNRNIALILKKDKEFGIRLQREIGFKPSDKNYAIEATSSGLMTLSIYIKDRKYYFHSNNDPFYEAILLANEWYTIDKSVYIIYGLGLGYHVAELAELDENIIIHVFESDWNIIQLAFMYSDLAGLLSSDRIYVHYDPDFIELSMRLKQLNEKECFVVHYPSIQNIKNDFIRQQIDDFFVMNNSSKNSLNLLNFNFEKNIARNDDYIDTIKQEFKNKDLYIVAAGPSLDRNYMGLKNIKHNAVILSTGTVMKKLLNAGIKPDYVIITDPNKEVYRQIEGIEQSDVPLLYMSSACYKVPERYSGKKYLICQKDYHKAEQFAKEKGYMLFNTGGSVSTTALDIGIKFGCKRIIFIGLDLAYTNNQGHALDTPTAEMMDTTELRKVLDINGRLVGTGKSLDIYRKWIEKRIKGIDNIEFIDATEGGALIEGMRVCKLVDVI
jgi:hypothetical protein